MTLPFIAVAQRLKTVISLMVHKSIYRHNFCDWELISYRCTRRDIAELE